MPLPLSTLLMESVSITVEQWRHGKLPAREAIELDKGKNRPYKKLPASDRLPD